MFRTSRLLVFLLLSLSAVAASGLNNRSAVSVNGSDTNPCTAMSPCRSFVAALAATNPGGEVIALDSGGYGTFVVNKSVSVIGAPGIHAAITVASGKGIDVSTASLDIVTIRNINITATSSDADGISATMFYHLSIEGCHVSGGGHGIVITGPTYSMASIVDTVVQGASYGFFIVTQAVLVRCRAQKSENQGLYVAAGDANAGAVSAVDFVATGNKDGVAVESGIAGHVAAASLERAVLSGNFGSGAYTAQVAEAGTDAFIWVSNSTVFHNGGAGFAQLGASFFGSMNNNLVAANGTAPTIGTITLVGPH